jgi:hypothetical protein
VVKISIDLTICHLDSLWLVDSSLVNWLIGWMCVVMLIYLSCGNGIARFGSVFFSLLIKPSNWLLFISSLIMSLVVVNNVHGLFELL